MLLYHSSTVVVERPDTSHSRPYLDFGQGFYLTTIPEQAQKYAERFIRRHKPAWVNSYELSDDLSSWKIRRFDSYDREWLDFISMCRAGRDTSDYDMVIGGIANDKVILTLDRYFAGELSQEDALGLLKFEHPNIQYCIRSDKMLNGCLTYLGSRQL